MRPPLGSPSRALAPTRSRIRVLFLCESNGVWSLLAEALLDRAGRERFQALSAGLFPAAAPDPLALEALVHARLDVAAVFPKSFAAFREPGALPLDLLITNLDLEPLGLASGWPGHPALLHWNLPDPAKAPGDDAARRAALHRAFADLQNRVHLLLALPPAKLDQLVDAGRRAAHSGEAEGILPALSLAVH